MIPTRFTPEARADLRDIALRCRRIGEFPHAGAPRPHWGEGIRIAVHGRCVIVYRVGNETVQVLRVVHGARDLDALFEEEPLPE